MDRSRIVVVIPALNEVNEIKQVVAGVLPFADVIVVDDGSKDQTALVAENAGAILVVHERTMGYDSALESGLFQSIELGYEYAITMDADGQHSPENLKIFITKLMNGADLVIGVRSHRQRMAEILFSSVSQYLWGVIDPLCGMKGYRLNLLSKVGYFDSYKSIGTEYMIRAVKFGYLIEQVSLEIRERSGSSRFGSGFAANWKIVRALTLGLFNSRRLAWVKKT